MPTDPDRAYAKKHKINDLLNELYLELTKTKPEKPIEFAIKHLESKLPPKEPDQLSFKINPAQSEPSRNLLQSLFNKTNENNLTDPTKFVSPISTFNILNRVGQTIVKVNKELSNEEILEKENIVFQSKHEDEESNEPSKVTVKYKNELKNRKLIDQHKNEIKKLVESNFAEEKNAVLDESREQKPDSYSQELMHEIITADNLYHIEEKKPKKKQQKLRRQKSNVDLAAPLIKLIVCQFCSKIQDKLDEENVKIRQSLIKDKIEDGFKNVVDEKNNDEKNIFDFFPRASVEKKEENIDDEIIESASQVSGPRKIEPYEAQSSRNDFEQDVKEDNENILAWVLNNKFKSELRAVDAKSESTLVGSKTTKKEASPKPASRQSSAASVKKKPNGSYLSARSEHHDSSRQQWKFNYQSSSNSELSGLKK